MIRSICIRSTRTPLRQLAPSPQRIKWTSIPTCRTLLAFYYVVPRFNLNLYVEHIQSSLHAYIYIQTVHTLGPTPLLDSRIVIQLSYFLIGVFPNRVHCQ